MKKKPKKMKIESFSWRIKIDGLEYGAVIPIAPSSTSDFKIEFEPKDCRRTREAIDYLIVELFKIASKGASDSVCRVITGKSLFGDLLEDAKKEYNKHPDFIGGSLKAKRKFKKQ